MASTVQADKKTQPSSDSKKNIVFFHPDLGIGGAERLIVDAAVGLQELGHKVTIFTSHCDPQHCFEEARDGTLDVRVHGNRFFPPTILNRFHILLAILRQIHLIFTISVSTNELSSLKPDVFIVDQLSACVPLLRWLYPTKQRTLFYCHFPDQLLAQRTETGLLGAMKKVYRFFFDFFEGWSMDGSDRIVVNSNFTKSVSKKVFPMLDRDLDIIYPCVDLDEQGAEVDEGRMWDGQFKIFLSINRFERKKDIGLAIRAFRALSPEDRKSTRLILAGGYDSRVQENVQYHNELVQLAEKEGLKTHTAKTVPTALAAPSDVEVLFLLSVPGPFKKTLLRNAQLLLYTPTNEHFGIVPVEAMQYGVPVLASNTGGPRETIVEGKTGWLRDVKNVNEWSQVMRMVTRDMSPSQLQSMREQGKSRVKDHFTRLIMARNFERKINEMVVADRPLFLEREELGILFGVGFVFVAALILVYVNVFLAGGRGGVLDMRASEFARIRRGPII